jgi:hypothetical protein
VLEVFISASSWTNSYQSNGSSNVPEVLVVVFFCSSSVVDTPSLVFEAFWSVFSASDDPPWSAELPAASELRRLGRCPRPRRDHIQLTRLRLCIYLLLHLICLQGGHQSHPHALDDGTRTYRILVALR